MQMPDVVFATDYKYMCSEPGQAMIKEAIVEQKLDRIPRAGAQTCRMPRLSASIAMRPREIDKVDGCGYGSDRKVQDHECC